MPEPDCFLRYHLSAATWNFTSGKFDIYVLAGAVLFSYAGYEPQLVSHETAAIQFCQGTGFDNVRHSLGLATRTQISVCKSPFPSAGTAVSLFRAKTVQQRPLLPREVETQLPDCEVTH